MAVFANDLCKGSGEGGISFRKMSPFCAHECVTPVPGRFRNVFNLGERFGYNFSPNRFFLTGFRVDKRKIQEVNIMLLLFTFFSTFNGKGA